MILIKPKTPPQPPHKQKPGYYQFVEVPSNSMINTQNPSLPTNQAPNSCSTCYTTSNIPTRDSDAIVFRD